MADKPFPAYEGDAPYFFVSYAHEDADTVYPELGWLRDAGFNIWYDEGISPGSRWSDALAQAIADAAHVVFFVTPRSVASKNCLDEVGFALERDKPSLAIHLAPTQLPPGLALRMGSHQAILRYELGVDAYREKVSAALAQAGAPARPVSKTAEPASRRARPPKIAILPFACQARDEDVLGWAEGLPEGIARSLSSTTFEQVLGRAQHLGQDARDVGRSLDTQYMLSGDVRTLAGKVRVTVSLTDTRSGEQLWSDRSDHPIEHLLDEEDALLESLQRRIRESVRVRELGRIRQTPREALDAWALITLGIQVPTDVTSGAECVALVEEALDADPDYAIAHGEFAWLLTILVTTLLSRDPEGDTAEALAHADRALELAPDHPHVLNNCSWAHRILGNEVMALELAQRAAAMTGMGWGRSSLHLALIINGRGTEVVEEAQERPGGVPPLNMSYALVALGRYQEALDHARKAAGLEPRNPYRWTELANILGHLGRNDEALRAVESVRDLMPKWRFASSERGMQVMWRNNPEIVGNMLDGLRKLGID